MSPWWIVLIVGVILLGFAFDRLALWMEARGWIYWRRTKGRGSASIGLLEEIYQPSMTHVFEEETRQLTEAEQDAMGEGK